MKKIYVLIALLSVMAVSNVYAYENMKPASEAEKLYMEGFKKVDKKDTAGAVVDWKKACEEMKYRDACSSLGWVYYMGMGLKQDNVKAVTYFKKACELQDGKSCSIVGELYEKGAGVVKDLAQSKKYYQEACKIGPKEPYCYQDKIK